MRGDLFDDNGLTTGDAEIASVASRTTSTATKLPTAGAQELPALHDSMRVGTLSVTAERKKLRTPNGVVAVASSYERVGDLVQSSRLDRLRLPERYELLREGDCLQLVIASTASRGEVAELEPPVGESMYVHEAANEFLSVCDVHSMNHTRHELAMQHDCGDQLS